jgi:hypothetical protein
MIVAEVLEKFSVAVSMFHVCIVEGLFGGWRMDGGECGVI